MDALVTIGFGVVALQLLLLMLYLLYEWPAFIKIPEESIRERAHKLWQKRGSPESDAQQDWIKAERDLRSEYRRRLFDRLGLLLGRAHKDRGAAVEPCPSPGAAGSKSSPAMEARHSGK